MRPEISNLIRDDFYPTMKDHLDVFLYPAIKGILHNVYFIAHSFHEEEVKQETKTYKNDHEAKYLVSLCEYLVQQGYKPDNISVLTTYRGQLAAITSLIKSNPKLTEDLRVSTVDNYQGEENDIILLSLVRSNTHNKIGFLREPNRVNVALSRAKHGLYVIGNLEFLGENCKLWNRITTKLKVQNQFGTSLPIVCLKHKTNVRMIAKSQSFQELASGGKCQCSEACKTYLPCGHICKLKCHEGVHHCQSTVIRFYECGHEIVKQCTGSLSVFTPILQQNCGRVCNELLKCGHRCELQCHGKTKHTCTEYVKVTLDCGHKITTPCPMETINTLQSCLRGARCSVECGRLSSCGHLCSLKCGHLSAHDCQQNLNRRLPCNHVVRLPCKTNVSSYECKEMEMRYLSCGKHKVIVKCQADMSNIVCKSCSKQSKCVIS